MAAFLCCKEIDKKLGLDLFVDCSLFDDVMSDEPAKLEGA